MGPKPVSAQLSSTGSNNSIGFGIVGGGRKVLSSSPSSSNSNHHHNHHHNNGSVTLLFLRMKHTLVTALLVLCFAYATVTVVTYKQVSVAEMLQPHGVIWNQQQQQEQQQQVTGSGSNINNSAESIGQQNQRRDLQEQTVTIHPAITKLQHTFPIHVGSDTIVIEHPGIAIIKKMEELQKLSTVAGKGGISRGKVTKISDLPKDLPQTITVPQFFDESHGYIYNNKDSIRDGSTIRHYLGDGETLLTPELASTIGSWYIPPSNNNNGEHDDATKIETIYCSIASYRDPECSGSVEDLYARADHPERIRVAIIDQRVKNSTDPICVQPAEPCDVNPHQNLCRYRHLIDYYELDARLAVGPVFARHLAHRHYRGEYFAMQIDSHVRFVAHWDTDIIEQWRSANNEMGVLSTYLSDIQGSIEPGTYRNIHRGRPIMCASDYEGSGQYKHLRHGQQPEGTPGIHGQPTLHPFWAAGFSFARGHFVIQVPYDQCLPMVFQGEEISIGLRGFTYGYDYYAPERSVCFHMYAIKENEAKRKAIPLFWENANMYTGVGMRAMKRLNSIIGMTGKYTYQADTEWDTSDIHKYGLGNVRRTHKFFDVFGIHTANETVEHHLCRFVGKPMMKVFMPALRPNRMGLDYDLIDYQFVDQWPDEPDNGKVKPRKKP